MIEVSLALVALIANLIHAALGLILVAISARVLMSLAQYKFLKSSIITPVLIAGSMFMVISITGILFYLPISERMLEHGDIRYEIFHHVVEILGLSILVYALIRYLGILKAAS